MRSIGRTAARVLAIGGAIALLPFTAEAQARPDDTVERVVERVAAQTSFRFADRRTGELFGTPEGIPDSAVVLASPLNDWRYWNGVVGLALFRASDVLERPEFARVAMKNIAFAFENYQFFQKRHAGESKWSYPFGQLFLMEELDDCGAMGAVAIEARLRTQAAMPEGGSARVLEYIDRAATHILTRQPRLKDGTLVRSFPRKWTLWGDDLYMSVPFLVRLAELRRDIGPVEEAVRQVIRFQTHLYDTAKGLMAHCWYSDGHAGSRAFWGRANGWTVLAQADLLDRLPGNHAERSRLEGLLRRQLLGLIRYQSRSGRWHQLLDQPGSYLETSCSAMFTYGIARAVRTGILSPGQADAAFRGWEGVRSAVRSDGQIEGICAGTGVSDNLQDYFERPTPLDDPHGTGAVILAGLEIRELRRWLHIRATKEK